MISKLPKWAADLSDKAGSFMSDMKILDAVYINPNIKKVRFHGNVSRMNFQIGYAQVIRVSDTEFRNYTPAYHDAKRGVLDIIFHIHGNGVGSRYIDALKTDDKLRISVPRGRKLYDPSVKQQFFFGDETSLGLACSLLPLLQVNQHQYHFYFELDDENMTVPELLGLTNYTVLPKKIALSDEKKMSDLPVFQTPAWQKASFILTGNVRSVQTFRKMLKKRTSGKIFSQGYWLEGKKGL